MGEGLSTMFRVGRYTCSIQLPAEALRAGIVRLETRWLPEAPMRLSKAELHQYRAGRDVLLAEAARLLGGHILVGEI